MSIINNSVSHCLVCNNSLYPDKEEGKKDVFFLFNSKTTATQHDLSVLLGSLVKAEICSEEVHSDIICRRCFQLLDRIDFLQDELSSAIEKIINQFQLTKDIYINLNKVNATHGLKEVLTVRKSCGEVECQVPENIQEQVMEESPVVNCPETFTLSVVDGGDIPDEVSEAPKMKTAYMLDKNAGNDTHLLDKRNDMAALSTNILKPRDMEKVPPSKKPKVKLKMLTEHNLKTSLILQATSSPVECSRCSLTFSASLGLRSHLGKSHSVPEWDTDEVVLKDWIKQKTRNQEDSLLNLSKIVCPWCQELYESFEEYYSHLYDSHLLKSYGKYNEILKQYERELSCRWCENLFDSLSSLEDHLRADHNSDPTRSCLLCEENCRGYGALLRHVNHHILGVQLCSICPCRYSTQKQFISHLDTFHRNKYSVKCTQCSLSFMSYSSYEEHKNAQHMDEKEPEFFCESKILGNINSKPSPQVNENLPHCSCDSCNMKFKYRSQYEKHIYDFHPNLFKFRCEECECLFKNFGALISHQMSHIFGAHYCPHCNIKFSKVNQIKKHISYSHPFIRGLECKLCVKIFKSYDTYLNHLKLKHPEASGNTISKEFCTVCSKSFANKYQLKLHSRNHANEVSVCNVCGMHVKYLAFHMNTHTKAVSYSCAECGVVYNCKNSLLIHIKRTHKSETYKKHNCLECNKKFLSTTDLQIHSTRVHRGERKFKCKLCPKSYKNKVSLSYHLRKHTGHKPHQCTLCENVFESPPSLKQHIEKDHKAIYKGVYFKKKSNIEVLGKMSEMVHINVPSSMRREVVSASSAANTEEEVIVVAES